MHDKVSRSSGIAAAVRPRILLSSQTLAAGNGGICAVARMTAMALSDIGEVRALACQDDEDARIGTVPIRAFHSRRLPFALANFLETRRATHVIYDFAGTARAHPNFPFLRRPYAVWLHGWEVWHNPPRKYLAAIERAALVLANSAYTRDRAREVLPTSAAVTVCALGTAVDAPPPTVGPSDGPPTVMLLGRADELFAKGHDILIEVWPNVVSAVPGARLLLVGGGPCLGRVTALAANSPVRQSIEIVGFIPDGQLEPYWQRASVFAMLGFAEGFGIVYADAMRHGLPVVASTDDAGQEVNVDGVTGFNVARSDKKRLVEILVTLLRERDYARSLGAAGHARWHRHYSFSAFRQRLLAAASEFLSPS